LRVVRRPRNNSRARPTAPSKSSLRQFGQLAPRGTREAQMREKRIPQFIVANQLARRGPYNCDKRRAIVWQPAKGFLEASSISRPTRHLLALAARSRLRKSLRLNSGSSNRESCQEFVKRAGDTRLWGRLTACRFHRAYPARVFPCLRTNETGNPPNTAQMVSIPSQDSAPLTPIRSGTSQRTFT